MSHKSHSINQNHGASGNILAEYYLLMLLR